MAEQPTPVEVFCCCSYSRDDTRLLKRLQTHLKPLQREGAISLWYDRLIVPGADRAKTIHTKLETASIILLLVSPDFLDSDYCYSIGRRALERHVANEARVVPILIRSVGDWKDTPFGNLQASPSNTEPISTSRNKDQAFNDVVAGLRKVIADLSLLQPSAPRAALSPLSNDPYPHVVVEVSLVGEGQRSKAEEAERIRGVEEEQQRLAEEKRIHQSAEGEQVLLAREEPLHTIESSQAAISPQRLIMLPPLLFRRVPKRLHLSPFVVLILVILLLLSGVSGGSLIYRAAIGYFPWQASLRPSASSSSHKTVQSGASALGRSWHTQVSDTTDDLSGVAWSGSRFIVVGGNCRLFFLCSSTILTSPDGITWTPQDSTTWQHLHGVAWSGSHFVTVGDSGTILTSSDGITWTSQDTGINSDLSGVAWSGSRFVAVGDRSCRLFFLCSSIIFTSPDGITWTPQHSPTNQHLHGVTWSGSRFVAVGNSGTIFTSPDGITWTSQSSGTKVDLLGVVWSGSRFVIVGNSGTIFTSSNGITWTPQHSPTTNNLDDIVWSGSRFVVVGNSGTILTSPDGVTWTSQHSDISQGLDNIVWSGSRFVVVGNSGVILTSP